MGSEVEGFSFRLMDHNSAECGIMKGSVKSIPSEFLLLAFLQKLHDIALNASVPVFFYEANQRIQTSFPHPWRPAGV